MDRRRIIAFCAALSIMAALVSACGGGTSPGSGSSPQASVESPTAAESSPPASPSPDPALTESGATPEEPQTSSAPEPEETVKAYRMNANYFIVPIDKEQTNGKVVLLTFDDGPKAPETLDPLLDTLDKHQAKAIFFVNGYRVKANPELLKKIDERGQVIGNHSWDHIDLKKEQAPKIKEQIESVQEIVKDVTGRAPVFFRPPHGSSNDAVKQIAKDNGLLFMTWSNGSLDWDMGKIAEDKRPQAVIDNVMDQLHSGSNILMHELPWTAKALDDLLTQLEEKGYAFVDPNAIDIEL
ncbi:polysaccharide deacetylase family protein [Cohnella hongkongensis]|uniref:Polysaccharide deacetylase family protein n=1 Tax=Cohnella hongkongensis TaxID=178337 RepID=A0ABV9FDM4_9BACL